MSRLKLHEKLLEFFGENKVYFQPPEKFKMSYPCVIYSLSDLSSINADNKTYLVNDRYRITYVTNNPDDQKIKDVLFFFDKIRFVTSFISDRLYHYEYELYYK